MKVALIYPPEYNTLWMPYGSLPALTAFLRAAGINTEQHDWNIDIHDELLTRDRLERLWNDTSWVENRKAPYPGVPDRHQIAARLKERLPAILDGIGDAISTFRDPAKFHDIEQYVKAQETFADALLLVAASSWTLEDVLKSPAEALTAAMDPSVNIYLPFLVERVAKLIESKPDLVGLSVTLPRQFVPALAIAKLIKDANPKIHITLGGAYPTMIAHAIENSPALFDSIDSMVLSEGEVGLLALARAVEGDTAPSEAPGILYRDNGAVKRSSLPVMIDADELHTPDFDGLPLDKYLSPEPVLPLFSSRGCYWRRCAFCSRPDRRGFSQRSPGQVIKDIAACVKKYNARMFHFSDNAIRPRRMAAIADALGEAGIEISWTGRTRFSPEITVEWCERVAAGGLTRIIFGVESGSKRMLDVMQKGFRVDEIPKALQGLAKAGIDATLYLMVGFPTETREEANRTLKFIEGLKDSLTPYTQYYVSPFGMAHSSPIHKAPEQFGITKFSAPAPDDLRNPYCFNFETSTGMDRKETEDAYIEFRERLAMLTTRAVPMPHDMLIRKQLGQIAAAAPAVKPVLKMNAIPHLSEDLRADRGYLRKGEKKFRIDEYLGALIELLDSKKSVKQILAELTRSRGLSMANAFIFVQQLYEEGVIVAAERD